MPAMNVNANYCVFEEECDEANIACLILKTFSW
jgi:hypothetical protein